MTPPSIKLHTIRDPNLALGQDQVELLVDMGFVSLQICPLWASALETGQSSVSLPSPHERLDETCRKRDLPENDLIIHPGDVPLWEASATFFLFGRKRRIHSLIKKRGRRGHSH